MDRSTSARQRARNMRRGRRTAPAGSKSRTRLVFCGVVFVLLVAVKLLFPQRVGKLARSASQLIGRDADFQAAFAAMGRAISGEAAVGDSLQEAYTAVFSPSGSVPAQKTDTAAEQSEQEETEKYIAVQLPLRQEPVALAEPQVPAAREPQKAAEREEDMDTLSVSASSYSSGPLPANASLEQRNLGFPHQSPVVGALTSPFGWRDHPIDGETRFHYGVDLAADTGTAIRAFADGEVYATGESSSLGKYIMVRHSGGYMTLYGHCSRVTALSGPVSMGDKIAEAGQSGMATGPHLHFELQDGSLYLNPIYYVALG